jgi:CubicO group peptidase (beta-lactamase class C family)
MRFVSALLAACGLLSCAPAAVPVTRAAGAIPRHHESDAALGGKVDRFVAGFGQRWGEAYAVSGYLTAARDGQVILARSYGRANREKDRKADADTCFRIASLTKQFTAVAIVQLVERGLLHFDDPVRKHLPGYPRTGDLITIHQLLTHTSGIPEYEAEETLMAERGRLHSHEEVLASFKDRPLDFKPGERFSYSNSNYVLLGLILEKITGQSYESYLHEQVLAPAGMRRTTTVDAPADPNTAVGYIADPREVLVPAPPMDTSILFAAGSLRSTARDLIQWDRALAGVEIVGGVSKQRMFTPEEGGYACGWHVSRDAGHAVLWHEGRIEGFTSYIGRVPDEGLVVIALFNNDGLEPGKIAGPVLRMALTGETVDPPRERSILPLDAGSIAAITGDYRLTEKSRTEAAAKFPQGLIEQVLLLSIVVAEGRLYMKPSGQPGVQLFPAEDGVFFTKRDGIELVAELGSSGGISHTQRFRLRQEGFEGVYEQAGGQTRAPR